MKVPMLLLAMSLPAGAALGAAATPADAPLLAQDDAPKKKKKKKKKKKAAESDAASAEGDGADGEAATGGAGTHASQGSSGPYRGVLTAFTGGFLSLNSEQTPDEGDPSTTSGSAFSLGARYLHLFAGMFGVGPVFEYTKFSGEATASNTDPTTGKTTEESIKFETTDTKFGVAAQVFLGDLDKAAIVPYVGLQFVSVSTESTLGGEPGGKVSGTEITLAGGAELFLAQHVALEAQLDYTMRNGTATSISTSTNTTTGVETTTESETKQKSSEFGVTVGLSLFL